MSAVPKSVGVFFGQVDKRPKGWYWVDAKSDKSKQAIRGPFERRWMMRFIALYQPAERLTLEIPKSAAP